MATATVKQKKKRGKKALTVTFSVIAVIIIAAVLFIAIVTHPVNDKSEKAVPVGGMLISDTIDYKSESAQGLEHNAVIKLMQMIWRFCYDGDMAKHADQTPPDVEMIKDLPYIDDGNLYHQLDVFYPKGTESNAKLPVIIDIHGGGWMYATKDLNEYYCRALADRGFIVFSISYRLVPDVTVNEQIQDCTSALKWISENMNAYPCEQENIMLTGDSAGGQLALYCAVLAQSSELREVFETVDPEMDIDALLLTSPVPNMDSGALSIYTKALWGRNYKDKATYNYMNAAAIMDYAQLPPTYLITSSGDSLAHNQTVETAELLKKKGVACTLKDYDKFNGKSLPHVFSVLYPFDEIGTQTIDDALAFYKDVINQKTTV